MATNDGECPHTIPLRRVITSVSVLSPACWPVQVIYAGSMDIKKSPYSTRTDEHMKYSLTVLLRKLKAGIPYSSASLH